MTTKEQLLNHLYTLLVVSVVVFLVALYIRPLAPRTITLGALSEQTSDLRGQRVVVTNAVNWSRRGRYLTFETDNPLRRRVVFILSVTEVDPGCTTFRGYCYGVFEEPILGCPHDPPFLLVMDVKPVKD